jgi:hypothetical protein
MLPVRFQPLKLSWVIVTLAALLWLTAVASAQLTDSIIEPGHPAIGYPGEANDAVARLNRKLQSGEARLEFEEGTGYLKGLLAALDIPIESQVAVFSGTSLQARIINARNPRTIFFNDSTAVGWMAGGLIEVASLDPKQGANFYLLPQQTTPPLRQLARDTRCLACHYSTATLGVPGFLVRSIPSSPNGMIMPWLGNYTTDHRSPLAERWGGWYVTGRGRTAPRQRADHRSIAAGRAHRRRQSERHVIDRSIRRAALSVAAQRHRCAAGLRSSNADDESAHQARLGGENSRRRGRQWGGAE